MALPSSRMTNMAGPRSRDGRSPAGAVGSRKGRWRGNTCVEADGCNRAIKNNSVQRGHWRAFGMAAFAAARAAAARAGLQGQRSSPPPPPPSCPNPFLPSPPTLGPAVVQVQRRKLHHLQGSHAHDHGAADDCQRFQLAAADGEARVVALPCVLSHAQHHLGSQVDCPGRGKGGLRQEESECGSKLASGLGYRRGRGEVRGASGRHHERRQEGAPLRAAHHSRRTC